MRSRRFSSTVTAMRRRLFALAPVLLVGPLACGSSSQGGALDSGTDAGGTGHHDGSIVDSGKRADAPHTDASHGSGSGSGRSDGGTTTSGSGTSSRDGGATSSGSRARDGGASTKGDGGHDGGRSDGSGSGTADAGKAVDGGAHSDAGGADAGWAFGCSGTFQTGPTVPASGYLFFAQGTKSYALVSGDTSWTVVDRNAAIATTGPIPFPAGVSSMPVFEVGRAYDGSELLLYGTASAPFATFWDGAAFSTPVALPANTATIRADGARHIFAVDSSNILWDGRSGTFVNRGAIPFQNAIPFVGSIQEGYWQWTVSPADVVTVVYAAQTPVGVVSQRYDTSLTWSSVTVVYTTDTSTDSYGDIQVSGGLDGSVHTLFVDTYDVGTGGETGTVAGYARTHGTDAWDAHSLPYLANGIDVEASSYDDVQALFASATSNGNGGFTLGFEWATPACNGTAADWWTTIPVQSDAVAQAGAPRMGVGAGGYPSFYLAGDPSTAIVTTF